MALMAYHIAPPMPAVIVLSGPVLSLRLSTGQIRLGLHAWRRLKTGSLWAKHTRELGNDDDQ
ncbi:hypothetical protein PT974_00877 [Cladobotryum mycophilum]|uniref:Uncharacterized protein n=1 Tax=Cladobotryum mycophilum TaxID=491253 RepID=A0ABR0T234_9HYPO